MIQDLQIYPNRRSWVSDVKSSLETLGFYNIWLEQGVGDINLFLLNLKQRLTDNFIQTWSSQLENSTRVRTYRLYSNFDFKLYLDTLNIKKYRQAFTKLRLSSHYLEIEVGRWHKPDKTPINERKCQICNTIEDEFHFMLECPLYQELRQKYIKKYYWKRPNIIKFQELLSSENKNVLKNMSVFIQKSFMKRNSVVLRN